MWGGKERRENEKGRKKTSGLFFHFEGNSRLRKKNGTTSCWQYDNNNVIWGTRLSHYCSNRWSRKRKTKRNWYELMLIANFYEFFKYIQIYKPSLNCESLAVFVVDIFFYDSLSSLFLLAFDKYFLINYCCNKVVNSRYSSFYFPLSIRSVIWKITHNENVHMLH